MASTQLVIVFTSVSLIIWGGMYTISASALTKSGIGILTNLSIYCKLFFIVYTYVTQIIIPNIFFHIVLIIYSSYEKLRIYCLILSTTSLRRIAFFCWKIYLFMFFKPTVMIHFQFCMLHCTWRRYIWFFKLRNVYISFLIAIFLSQNMAL